MVVLGLDSSTSVTGWAFAENKKILSAGFIDTKKLTTTKEKTLYVISVLEQDNNISKMSHINLEAALSGFAGGFTSQQVIITLTRHNAVFAYILEEYFKKKVNLVSVTTSRKHLFGKCRMSGIKPKNFVKLQLETLIPDVIKFTKRNKKGNWDERNSDMYDAVVCAMYEESNNVKI